MHVCVRMYACMCVWEVMVDDENTRVCASRQRAVLAERQQAASPAAPGPAPQVPLMPSPQNAIESRSE